MRTPLRALTAAAVVLPLTLLVCGPTLAAGKGRTRTASTDTTAPTVSISTPAAGSTTGSAVTVAGVASDSSGISSVSLQVDGGAWQPASGYSSWSVPLSGFSAGAHTVTAKALDPAGNAGTASRSFTVSTPTTTPSPTPSPSPTTSPSPSPSPSPTTSPSPAPTGTTSTGSAPSTQGSWVSPEGMTINVSTAGPWTIAKVYQLMLNAGAAPGDFARVAPTITVNVQDTYSSQSVTSVMGSAGAYYDFMATIYLQGVNSTFATTPDTVSTHEYGHAWTQFHAYIDHGGDWSGYLGTRWSSTDGSVRLGQDSRLGSSYTWDVLEIVADDYRLLFGDAAAISGSTNSLNPYIEPPAQQPGLRDWFLKTWM